MPAKIVLASGNPGKLRELERILSGIGAVVVAQSAFDVAPAEETGETFEENALEKARHAALATGLPAIGDDSGLVVDALDGRPGIYSARYAGDGASDADNIDKLLSELAGVPRIERSAAFLCAAAFVGPDGEGSLVAEGRWDGEILEDRRGRSGFGYDPVFLDRASGLTAAELSPSQKDALSHRGQALRRLAALIMTRCA